jgi:hypothetical protein
VYQKFGFVLHWYTIYGSTRILVRANHREPIKTVMKNARDNERISNCAKRASFGREPIQGNGHARLRADSIIRVA